MKVHQLKALLNEAMPDDEVELIYQTIEGRKVQVFPSEVHRGVFTRISEAELDMVTEPRSTLLVERSQPTCRIILES